MNEYVPPPEHHTADDLLPVRLRRFVPLLAVAGISAALVGYLTGIREPSRTARATPGLANRVADVPNALTYSELSKNRLEPRATGPQTLAHLKYDRPGAFDPVIRTEEMKLAALADRARNRAFDGAPPTVPHPVEAQSDASCLACHGEGLKVGDRVASKISHALLTNCTQCHIEQAAVSIGNSFAGAYRAGPGQRASPGAPPTIPHPSWMRENCTSCHGPVARPGTRTTHPWLTNCTQCHVPSAAGNPLDVSGAKR